tara:strand:+ start:54 stop:572 length:519 start_codon:yes stop_codon:yes gene_type:complete
MLNKEQKNRIQNLAEFEWFNDDDSPDIADKKLADLIAQISTQEELLYAVIAKSWSFEESTIWLLLDHSLCDYGLALRIYWMSQPDFFYRQIEKQKKLNSLEIKSWKGIKNLESRLISEYYGEAQTGFNPQITVGREISDTDKYRPGIRLIPNKLKIPAKGVSIEFDHNQISS